MDLARVEQVVAEYCLQCEKYGKATRVERRFFRQYVKAVGRYLAWCAANDVEPILFLRERFARMARTPYAVPISQLASPKVLVDWKTFREGRRHQEEQPEAFARSSGSSSAQYVKSLRSPPLPAQEAFKRQYLASNRASLCLISEHSGGYDPRSGVCAACPIALACVTRLSASCGFDVAALRLGRFDLLPAAVASAALR